ncbi:ATP-binding protein [Paraburkholderia nodosa]|uniref:ATP-binding protein n=1 Tax=Paraburkholderia nodosa TaxID=392320 RepID=UPI00159F3358|nr:ATP-binding protein [Paraburkholderia nodosa]
MARRLCESGLVVCAALACLAQHGAPLAIDDLLRHRLILQRNADSGRTATTKPDGLGMGLPICRSIVQSHGGCLWVTPNAPVGVSFHFTLPAQGNASPPARI